MKAEKPIKHKVPSGPPHPKPNREVALKAHGSRRRKKGKSD